MTVRLIGLTGRKRSGKDTFAQALVEVGFRQVAFADPLRQAVAGLDPIVGFEERVDEFGFRVVEPIRFRTAVERYGYEEAKDRFPEVRLVLQRFGTEGIRRIDPGFWMRLARERILASETPLVFTDCRFPNEADMIRSEGGKVIRIDRPGLPDDDTHPSETALADYPVDAVIRNDGTLDEFRVKAETFASVLDAVFR